MWWHDDGDVAAAHGGAEVPGGSAPHCSFSGPANRVSQLMIEIARVRWPSSPPTVGRGDEGWLAVAQAWATLGQTGGGWA